MFKDTSIDDCAKFENKNETIITDVPQWGDFVGVSSRTEGQIIGKVH